MSVKAVNACGLLLLMNWEARPSAWPNEAGVLLGWNRFAMPGQQRLRR